MSAVDAEKELSRGEATLLAATELPMAEHVVAFVCCVVVAATDGTSPRSRVPTFAESEFLADVDPLTFSPIFALKEINQ